MKGFSKRGGFLYSINGRLVLDIDRNPNNIEARRLAIYLVTVKNS